MSERLLIDMDGVLADAVGRAFQMTDTRLSHADATDYWFSNLDAGSILNSMRFQGFFRSLDVITGAIQGVNRLREQYDVAVCTAPMPGYQGNAEAEKRQWLERHFDREFAESAIVTPDKHLHPAKAIIEDNPEVNHPGQIIMFHQRWNRNTRHYPRMFNWGDLDVVERVMES